MIKVREYLNFFNKTIAKSKKQNQSIRKINISSKTLDTLVDFFQNPVKVKDNQPPTLYSVTVQHYVSIHFTRLCSMLFQLHRETDD